MSMEASVLMPGRVGQKLGQKVKGRILKPLSRTVSNHGASTAEWLKPQYV